jgi:pSer/pThr/pTyr-binding forkhead associated (FHA) protein
LEAAPAAMELRFSFKSSSGKPRTHSKRLPILVGRSDAGDVKLRIPRDSVSRRHCEFVLDEDGRVCVRDLESTNGTFLEGRQLEPRVATPVPSGSMITLGNVGFRVDYAVAKRGGSPHDSDTLPIDAASEPPPAEPVVEAEELEPTVPVASAATPEPVVEPVVEPGDPADALPETLHDIAAAEPATEGDFGFLADGDAPAADAGEWPLAGEEPAAGEDQNLDDFFKGLS